MEDREHETKPSDITTKELLDAVIQTDSHTQRRISDLERKVGKFERIFETIFRQEAESRLGINRDTSGQSEMCGTLGPLAGLQLKHSRR